MLRTCECKKTSLSPLEQVLVDVEELATVKQHMAQVSEPITCFQFFGCHLFFVTRFTNAVARSSSLGVGARCKHCQ